MNSPARVGVALIAGLGLMACGSPSPTAIVSSTASATRSAVPSHPATSVFQSPTTASGVRLTDPCSQSEPAPQFAPSAPSARSLALVNLKGSNDFVVRDVTDINHPYTVSSLGNQVDYATQFVNAGELATAAADTGLLRMPLSGSPKTVVAACGTRLFAWSPDGTAAAYIRSAQDDPQLEGLHIVSGGRDSVVNTIHNPIQGGFGCENRSSCSGFAFRVLYSPDGAYISLVQTPGTGLHVWTSGGKLVTITTTTYATKPVWSGQTLYWRDNEGVEMWRNGVESVVLPGVSWNSPQASPAGGQIVYETRDASGTGHIHLLDTATGKARE